MVTVRDKLEVAIGFTVGHAGLLTIRVSMPHRGKERRVVNGFVRRSLLLVGLHAPDVTA